MIELYLAAALLFAFGTTGAQGKLVTVHVATNGNDTAPGTSAAPMKTLPAALKLAQSERAMSNDVAITLHGGLFTLEAPLRFSEAHSGITIAAAGQEVPVISGGRRIQGWRKAGGHLWQAQVPGVREGNWYFRQLFINGRRAIRARTPNEGAFLRMEGARFSDVPARYHFKPGDIKPAWAKDPDTEVVGLEKWTVFRQHIAVLSLESNAVQLSGNAAPHTREGGARYYIENTADGLDAPGEWHLDRKSGVVSYLARPDEDLTVAEVIAPFLEELVLIQGNPDTGKPAVSITLRGLTFSHTDWTLGTNGYVDSQAAVAKRGAVRVEFARKIVFEDCAFTRLGGYAIELGRGAQECRVVGNEMSDLGAGGVRVGETAVRTNASEAVHHNVIIDNHIHHGGRVFPPAVGVLILQSAHNRVAHNHIHDLYYTAVSVGWTWGYKGSPCHDNVIEFNHLHDIGQGLLSDMGGVYTLGPQPGTVVRNNRIHDVDASTYGGWGLYTDEGSTGIVMENNLVYRCKSAGFHQHYGKENVIRNNIFAFNIENQLMRSSEEAHLSFFFTNNIVYFGSGNLLGSTWKNDRFVMERNVYWDTRLASHPANLNFAGARLEQWRARGHDTNSVIADPLFIDAPANNFKLASNSPAMSLGFRPFNVKRIGIRDKAERK